MLNLNRKVTQALEKSTNAVQRDTAAKLKVVRALREQPELVDEIFDALQPLEKEDSARTVPSKPRSGSA
jgi:hypothetical protein